MYKSLRLLQENSWGPSAGSSRDHIKIGKRAEKQPTTHSDSFLTKLKSPISGRGTLTIPCKMCVFVSSEWGKSINQALSSVTFWNLGEICQLAKVDYSAAIKWSRSGWGGATGRPAGNFGPSVKSCPAEQYSGEKYTAKQCNAQLHCFILQQVAVQQLLHWNSLYGIWYYAAQNFTS